MIGRNRLAETSEETSSSCARLLQLSAGKLEQPTKMDASAAFMQRLLTLNAVKEEIQL